MLRASKVPSSKLGRLFHYGCTLASLPYSSAVDCSRRADATALAASLSWGAASESIRRTAGGTSQGSSVFMSDANIRRLVSSLTRMRGAALKLGQFMSIQGAYPSLAHQTASSPSGADVPDNNMLPRKSKRASSKYRRTPTTCRTGRWRNVPSPFCPSPTLMILSR